MLIEILLPVGRSAKMTKRIVAGAVDKLASQGFDPELIMGWFGETRWENWSLAVGAPCTPSWREYPAPSPDS